MSEQVFSDTFKETILQDKDVRKAISALRDLMPTTTQDGKIGHVFGKGTPDTRAFHKAEDGITDAAAAALQKHGIEAPTAKDIAHNKGRYPAAEEVEKWLVNIAKSGEPLGPVTNVPASPAQPNIPLPLPDGVKGYVRT